MITNVAVHGYRSLHDLVLPLGRTTVVTGANGTGKSNLYRALRLTAGVAHGRLIASLAAEGGLSQVLWAGPEQITSAMRRGEAPIEGAASRKAPVSLMLGVATEEFCYLVDLGLPRADPSTTAFFRDPEIKREAVFTPPVLRPATTLVDRRWSRVRVREGSQWRELDEAVSPRHSVMEEFADRQQTPELVRLRRVMAGWRFHDGLRTDPASPARRSCVATRTPVLADDAGDLAAAVATIQESAWASAFDNAVGSALDGARVTTELGSDGTIGLRVHQRGLLRPLGAAEISDGTLRFIMLAAALLAPEPPQLLVLNEPETSLHPDVLPALGDLVKEASGRTQVLLVCHGRGLVEALGDPDGDHLVHHELSRDTGMTVLAGQDLLNRPLWEWGRRRRW